jgi:hypothetical protein
MTAVGIYGDNSPSGVTAFETWLGRPVDQVLVSLNQTSWTAFDGSIPYELSLWKDFGHAVMWSVPLIVEGTNLHDAANGAYTSHWLAAAQALASMPGSDPIIIRTGWEFNSPFQPWAAAGHEADYIASYQHFVDTFRSVSNRFEFDWNFNIGQSDPSKVYPGDSYVDVISMDVYYNQAWDSTDPAKAFAFNVSRDYGMQWMQDFATAHGKPTAFSEWGVQNDNAGPYIDLMSKWFADHNVLYQNYWNSDADFQGKLNDGNKPDAAAAYKADFGATVAGATIYGTPVADTLYGTAANDKIYGDNGDDTIFGQNGNDEIHGGSGNDHLYGQAGNDTIFGEDGNDQIYGGMGDDHLYGQAGNDTIFGEDGNDQIYGGASDDSLYGQAGDDVLYGEDGNDLLVGGDGNDLLVGGAGDDILNGENGDDILIGSEGNDTMTGGAGHDTFVFAPNSGHDKIADFEVGTDHLDYSAFHFTFASLTITDANGGHDTLITTPAGESVLLSGIHPSQLHAGSDFIF